MNPVFVSLYCRFVCLSASIIIYNTGYRHLVLLLLPPTLQYCAFPENVTYSISRIFSMTTTYLATMLKQWQITNRHRTWNRSRVSGGTLFDDNVIIHYYSLRRYITVDYFNVLPHLCIFCCLNWGFRLDCRTLLRYTSMGIIFKNMRFAKQSNISRHANFRCTMLIRTQSH